jgi:RNA polymerase sigma-70 factor (family 1)
MTITSHTDDLELFSRLKKDDRQAFNTIFLKYHPGLVKYAKTLMNPDNAVIDDVIQETFLKIWNQRAVLVIHSSLSAFLFISLKNKIKGLYREKQFTLYDPTEMKFNEQICPSQSPENILIFKELSIEIAGLIKQLPTKTQLIYRMNREDNLSYDEIARQLAITRSSVKTHMFRALKFLKEYYAMYKTQS